ncbi:Mg-chelatase subunit ChlD [uncultured Clostridium sp.]|uniref:MucBP domain-containing protein n=1 Tax=uncultured Clostridium sp. TaxID=59620 RepID=UPI00082343E7|nr:MucBP domain-containing protein [uncultured Clostridium sp.]SCJ03602.1 Mg-chelatase subunit ChlD [uncultured Clostridium sp.]
MKKQNHLSLISKTLCLFFIISIVKYSSISTIVKAETLNQINRAEEEVKNTSFYEEKKITLKIQKDVLEPKEREKIDFEILIDASGSMRDSGSVVETQEVIKKFIDSLNPNYDRVSITTFRGPGYYSANDPRNYSKIISTIHEMDNDFASAKAAIDNMEFGGFTPLLDGLSKAKSNLDNSGDDVDRKVLLVIGDGHPNVGPERDYYYTDVRGNYYGEYPNYYPGDTIKKQRYELEEKWYNGEIDDNTYFSEDEILSKQENVYPGATKRSLDNHQSLKELKGTIYDNSKAEFYDLRYLIMEKIEEIKSAGYEVFSVFLNNEEAGMDGYQKFLAETNESEKLFKEIANDDKHYFYAENVSGLPKIFEDVKTTINTFDYFINDTIEDGFELMPETLQASQNGVIPKIDGRSITWDISGVPYKELEVSYHIKREIPYGTLTVRYIDEDNGTDLLEPIINTNTIGQAYASEKKILEGYEYINVVGDENGTYGSENTEVIYYYRKISKVDEKVSLDEDNGNKEIDTVTDVKENQTFNNISEEEHNIQLLNNKEELYKYSEKSNDNSYDRNDAIESKLPKTGADNPYLSPSLGIFFLVVGLYIYKSR